MTKQRCGYYENKSERKTSLKPFNPDTQAIHYRIRGSGTKDHTNVETSDHSVDEASDYSP